MKNLVLLILITANFTGAKGSDLDSANYSNTEIQGDLYLNLTFVKIGENHDTYNLEKAIDAAKLYLKSQFKPFKINFHFQATIEMEMSSQKLVSSWKKNNLPHFEDELVLFVYPIKSEEKTGHSYSFLDKSSDIGLVPYYNQAEFNHYVLKNILHMLGVNVVSFETWNENQENSFAFFESKKTTHGNCSFVVEIISLNSSKRKRKSFFKKKKSLKSSNFLNSQIACLARKNMNFNPILLAKKTCFSFPIPVQTAINSKAFSTITQLD